MAVSQTKLAEILLYSFCVGMFLGLVYDHFRIRRRLFPVGSKKIFKYTDLLESILVFTEDVIYAIICSIVVCIFLFYSNSGRQRGIVFAGAALGFAVYRVTLGRLIILTASYLVGFFKILLRKIYAVTLSPLFRLLSFIFQLTLGAWILRVTSVVNVGFALKRAEKGFGITS